MQPQDQMNQFNQPNQVPVQDKASKQKNKYVPMIVILAILMIGGLAFGGYELWQNMQKDEEIKTLQTTNTNLQAEKIGAEAVKNTDITAYSVSDINNDENIKYYYYASSSSDSGRYSLTLVYTEEDSGFFELINSGTMFNDSLGGYFTVEDGALTLFMGPFVEGNNFQAEENVLSQMGITLESGNNLQENYKGYKTVFSDGELKLGNIVFKKVN